MNAVVKAGVGLFVLVAVLTLILAFVGLHNTSPILAQIAFLIPAIVINGVCIFWGLSQTAADNGYLKQLLNAVLIGVGGGVLIFLFSWVLLTTLMPGYLEEVKTATIEWLESAGLPEQQLESQVQRVEATTPVSQAIGGLVGTLGTSVVLGAIIAIFKRRK
jgi:hypothetical protein